MTTGEMARLARTAVQLRPGQAGQRARLRAQRTALEHAAPLVGRWLLAGPDPASAAGWPAAFTPLDAAVWRGWADGAALQAGELQPARRDPGTSPPSARRARPTGRRRTGRWRRRRCCGASTCTTGTGPGALAASGPRADARRCSPRCGSRGTAAVRPGRGPSLAPVPGGPARLVALRAVPRPGRGRHRSRARSARARRARRVPAPQPGDRRRRQPPHQEPEGAGRAGGVLRRRRAAAPGAPAAAPSAGRAGAARRRPLRASARPTTARCWATSSTSPACCGAAGRGPARPSWPPAIAAMRRWLGAVLTPAGDVPLLNDGFPVSPELLAALRPAAPPPAPAARAAGHRAGPGQRSGGWHLLADVGLPCPRELPAHAHADTLGCLRPRRRRAAAHRHRHVRLRRRARCATTSGRPPRTTPWRWTGPTPPRSGARSGPAAGPGCRGASAARRRGRGDGRGRPRRLPPPAGPAVHRRRWPLRADGLRVDDDRDRATGGTASPCAGTWPRARCSGWSPAARSSPPRPASSTSP